jgi:hypothetical protein
MLPAGGDRDHDVDLFLCGHHVRASIEALLRHGAVLTVRGDSDVIW